MGVCGNILHISFDTDFTKFSFSSTESQLKDMGYTWDTPAWELERCDVYWHVDERGYIGKTVWLDDTNDRARRDFLGIYQTKELAKAALLEIRRKLGK